jgi:hypothetical protein
MSFAWILIVHREVAGPYGSKQLYKMLGYYCLIGLLRIHCLMGDFHLALSSIEAIELNPRKVILLFSEFCRYKLFLLFEFFFSFLDYRDAL